MKEINLTDPDFAESVFTIFCSDNPVIMLEFTGTYGLVAPNTFKGTLALDRTKRRLGGKYYGSILGNCDAFRKILPAHIETNIEDIVSIFERAFIRFDVACRNPNNKVVKDGRHQVLIENPNFRKQIEKVELRIIDQLQASDFFIENYQGLLCTSANISGHAAGAITNLQQALEFGKERGVELFVHSGLLIQNLGSYPSFYIGKDEISIERKGYRDSEILAEAKERIYKTH
jgi:hypothetical protein